VSASPRRSGDTGNVFRLEGEYWTLVYGGEVVRLRDSKGLHYLAQLIARPGQPIHVADLHQSREPPDSAGNGRYAEQARSAVTKRIKAALRTIEKHHPALGYHLRAAIRTGYRCVYEPGPGGTPMWTS
jgi:hypothetical protein